MEDAEENEMIPLELCSTIMSDDAAKDFIASLNPDELWEDPDFPADDTSLNEDCRGMGYEWKRPTDIESDPKLFVEEGCRSDIIQGRLADCWLMAACASLAINKNLLYKVMPKDQTLSGEGYTGVIRVRLWRFGEWVNVLIDDRLPCERYGLLYGRCDQDKEFWLPLLEKAFAKMCSGYEYINYGYTDDGLVDLTGGISKAFTLSDEEPEEVFKYMHRSRKSKALISSAKMSTSGTDEGLQKSHAYTITYVARIKHQDLGAINLVRLRNPWGHKEWQGEWRDIDELWDGVSDETKAHLKHKEENDGEFWMKMEDFALHFTYVAVCNMGPDYDDDGEADEAGQMLLSHDCWTEGETAGGAEGFSTYTNNPQYLLTIEPPENDEVDGGAELELLPDAAWSQVTVLQKSRKGQQKRYKIKLNVYKVASPECLTKEDLEGIETSLSDLEMRDTFVKLETGDYMDPMTGEFIKLSSGEYCNQREVVVRMEMPYGHYILVPSTRYPDQAGEFMIRVYYTKGNATLTKMK